MKIEKLELKGFGKLNNSVLDFKNGLNVVFGNNETGKSSIQWFIRGMLYGLKGGRTSKEGQLPAVKKFKPWTSNDYSGSMGYSLDNGEKFKVVRNYNINSVHIYDSLFNDITNLFDASKEKGIQFAEKQLGMNESCFDKTVFIKQMESRVDDDGSKELLNRLTNVAQTGFEDISFRKAQEALKEALKSYVGTDKTSTRPLDRVISRMEHLEHQRNTLLGKRETLFIIENELNMAVSMRNKLLDMRAVYKLIKEVLEIEKSSVKNKKVRNDLKDILKNITIEEEELVVTSRSVEEFNKTKGEFEKFSSYNNDDVDNIGLQYYEMLKIKEVNKRLEQEIFSKNMEKEKLQYGMSGLKTFENLGKDIEEKLVGLIKDIDHLKTEYDKSNLAILNERIKSAKDKDNHGKYNIIFSVVLSAAFILMGIYGISIGYVLAASAGIAAIILGIIKRKTSNELFDLLNQKKVSFVSISSIIEETDKKQKMFKSILSSVGTQSIEEFMKLKADYDNKVPQIERIKESIGQLKGDYDLNASRIKVLDEGIKEILFTAGVKIDKSAEITEDEIKSFKYGVRRYGASAPSINYTLQRTTDINKNLAGYYIKASELCCTKIEEKDTIKECICKVEEIINEEVIRLNRSTLDLKNIILEKAVSIPDIINLDKVLEGSDSSSISILLENECLKLESEYNSILLKIRECETILKSLSGDDEEIQRIDEEIGELEVRKNILHDTNISLRTALDILTEASIEIQRDFAPELNNKMSDIIKKITKGRYLDLRADDHLSLKTIAPETGDVVGALTLSGGTADQMYLALRIAMADIIASKKEKVPLIMDEAFAQYDDLRTMEAFQFLNYLSQDRQIIFFTCKGREVEIAREVCGVGVNIIELN